MKYIKLFLLIILSFIGFACTSVVERGVFEPYPINPESEPKYCFDGSPPIPDSKPFIYGGCDLSMPREEDTELIKAYKEFGIVWENNGCRGGCNGLCVKGPHVAFGGHCLNPPTPGTKEYNDIILGIGVTNWLYPKAKKEDL